MLRREKGRFGIAGAGCVALAGCMATMLSAGAEGAIVYSGVQNIALPATSSGLFLNVETGAFASGSSPAPTGWDVNVWGTATNSISFFSGGSGTVFMRAPGVTSGTNVANLALGTVIGSAGSFATSPNASFATNVNGRWNYGTANIYGFRFVSGLGGTKYGWMRIAVGADATSRAIVDWAYEDSGGSIPAGAAAIIPGPGAVALFALGFGRRSRRRA